MGCLLIQYKAFLKAVEGPFEDFVKSDVVNTYLQSIRSSVKSEVHNDGIPSEFLVVSGYEKERGSWGTTYDNQLRFGDEIYPVTGINETMVLTPNFFYSRKNNSIEIEYRMGLKKRSSVLQVFPVVLRKDYDNIEGAVLEDLCVIHTGIDIDPQTAAQLNIRNIGELTAIQKFLACFWNIDDYLRKQNPAFHSDFEIDIWKSVEVFSGRIVDQMLQRIAQRFSHDPRWMIPQAEMEYWQNLVSQIIGCVEKKDIINMNQILILVRNLCSFMVRFDNYDPLDSLAAEKISILPYVLLNLETFDREAQEEASIIAERSIYMNSDDLTEESVNLLLDIIIHRKKHLSSLELEILIQILISNQLIFEKEDLKIILSKLPKSNFTDELYSKFLKDIKTCFEQEKYIGFMQSFPRRDISWKLTMFNAFKAKLIQLDVDARKQVCQGLIKIYSQLDYDTKYSCVQLIQLIFTLASNLVSEESLSKLILILKKEHWVDNEGLLGLLWIILKSNTHLIKAAMIRIDELFLEETAWVKENAVKILGGIYNISPSYLNTSLMEKIISMLSTSDEHLISTTLDVILSMLKELKNKNQQQLSKINELYSDSDSESQIRAFQSFQLIYNKSPWNLELFNLCYGIVEKSERSMSIARESAGHFISEAIKFTIPYMETMIQPLLLFISANNKEIRLEALKHLKSLLVNCSSLLEPAKFRIDIESIIQKYISTLKEIPHMLKKTDLNYIQSLFFNEDQETQVIALFLYELALEFMPELVDQVGVEKLRDLLISSDYIVQPMALTCYRLVVKKTPQFIDKEGAKVLHQIFSKIPEYSKIEEQPSEEPLTDEEWKALEQQQYDEEMKLRKLLGFITLSGYTKYSELIDGFSEYDERQVAYEAYKILLKLKPELVTQQGIDAIFNCFSRVSHFDRNQIDSCFLAIEKVPQFISPEHIKVLVGNFTNPYRDVSNRAFELFKLALKKMPQKFNQVVPALIKVLRSDRRQHIERAFNCFSLLINKTPQFINTEGISAIIKALGTISRYAKELYKDLFEEITSNIPDLLTEAFPTFIEVFQNLKGWPSDPLLYAFNKALKNNPQLSSYSLKHAQKMISNGVVTVQFSGLFIFSKVFDSAPHLFTQEMIDSVSKLMSNQMIGGNSLEVFNLAVQKTPHLITQTGIDQINSFFFQRENPYRVFSEDYRRDVTELTLETLELALQERPKLISQKLMLQVIDMLPNARYEEIISGIIEIARKEHPDYFDEEAIQSRYQFSFRGNWRNTNLLQGINGEIKANEIYLLYHCLKSIKKSFQELFIIVEDSGISFTNVWYGRYEDSQSFNLFLSKEDFLYFTHTSGTREIRVEMLLKPLRFYANRYKYSPNQHPNGVILEFGTNLQIKSLETLKFEGVPCVYEKINTPIELNQLDRSTYNYQALSKFQKKEAKVQYGEEYKVKPETFLSRFEALDRHSKALPVFLWLQYKLNFPFYLVSISTEAIPGYHHKKFVFKIKLPLTKSSYFELILFQKERIDLVNNTHED